MALQKRRPKIRERKRLPVLLCNEWERTHVLVDALDECEAICERRSFPSILQSLPQGAATFFVTNRPKYEDIRRYFNEAPQIGYQCLSPMLGAWIQREWAKVRSLLSASRLL